MTVQKSPLKGLAWTATGFPEDLETLRIAWYYTWGCDAARVRADNRYVPMSREGLAVDLPANYNGWLLVFNEPNNPEPYGADLDPQQAADRYCRLQAELPQARMVVGGISAHAFDWMEAFVAALEREKQALPQTWHAHGYVEDWIEPHHLFAWWQKLQALTGGEYWITEFADTRGSPAHFQQLIEWFKKQGWIRRYAAFTSRARGDEPWYPPGWVVNLLDYETGQTTNLGDIYAQA